MKKLLAAIILLVNKRFYLAILSKINTNIEIRVLLTPSCWFRKYKTNTVWDAHLNMLIESENEIEIIDPFKCRIDGEGIFSELSNWKSFGKPNWKYFGSPWGRNTLPKRATAFKLHDIISKIIYNQNEKFEVIGGRVYEISKTHLLASPPKERSFSRIICHAGGDVTFLLIAIAHYHKEGNPYIFLLPLVSIVIVEIAHLFLGDMEFKY